MKLVITESQLSQIILLEEDSMSKGLKKLYDESKKIVSDSSSQVKLNLSLMLTWGAALAGIMGPLTEYMRGEHPELTESNISLIVTSVCVMLYMDYKPKYDVLFKKIEDEGLNKELDKCFNKGVRLKNAFVEFLKSLNLTIHGMTNIMSYAFLIPLLPTLYEISRTGYDQRVVSDIIKSLLMFGIVTVSGNSLKILISKIIDRFSL